VLLKVHDPPGVCQWDSIGIISINTYIGKLIYDERHFEITFPLAQEIQRIIKFQKRGGGLKDLEL